MIRISAKKECEQALGRGAIKNEDWQSFTEGRVGWWFGPDDRAGRVRVVVLESKLTRFTYTFHVPERRLFHGERGGSTKIARPLKPHEVIDPDRAWVATVLGSVPGGPEALSRRSGSGPVPDEEETRPLSTVTVREPAPSYGPLSRVEIREVARKRVVIEEITRGWELGEVEIREVLEILEDVEQPHLTLDTAEVLVEGGQIVIQHSFAVDGAAFVNALKKAGLVLPEGCHVEATEGKVRALWTETKESEE